MLPGRTLTPALILQALRRRLWLIVIPPAVTLFVALLYSARVIDLYQSEMLIAVDPQRVPDSFVRSTITLGADRRLEALKVKVLSRGALEDLIQRFDLYPAERKLWPIDDVIARTRAAIDMVMQIPRPRWGEEPQPTAFRVMFTYPEPAVATKVAAHLGKLFVDQNKKGRKDQADNTAKFLEDQLAEVRAELAGQERRLEGFRQRHGNELPTQMTSNLQSLSAAQMRGQQLLESIARDRDRKMMLERLHREAVHDANNAPPPAVTRPTPGAPATPVAPASPTTARDQLAAAKGTLEGLLSRYTPDHPDVARARRQVQEIEPKAAQEAAAAQAAASQAAAAAAAAATAAANAAPAATPTETVIDPARRESLRQQRAEIESLDRQIEFKEREEQRVQGEISEYKRRVEAVPGLESEWAALTRDYETKQSAYRELLKKSEEAKLAANLEDENIGERFRIVDPANVPVRPIPSKRIMYNGLGFGFGLALGIGLALLLELRDKSFRNAVDVVDVLMLPVLASVPRVETTVDRLGAQRRRLAMSVAGIAGIGVAGYMTWTLKLWNSVW